jgi:hypothetical protein
MNDDTPHKFEQKVEVTYSQYFVNAFAEQVALARELEATIGKEETHNILEQWSERRVVEGIEKMLKSEGIIIDNFEDFKKNQREMWESPRVTKTHTHELIEETGKTAKYTVTECIWAKIFQELDASDIGLLTMCKTDFAAAKVYNSKIELTRTKTIMEGHDCCDFVYSWEE